MKRRERPPDDVFEGPGFTMVRRGRFIETRTHRSAGEQEQLKRRMWESRPRFLDEIKSRNTELEQIINKYTSFDLVANLFLRCCPHDPDEYVESESKLHPHYVEHAAMLELKNPRYQLREPVLVDASDVERAYTLIDEIFDQTMWYHIAEAGDPSISGPPSTLDLLRFSALLHGISVRSPAYSSHWRDVLVGLFSSRAASEELSRTYRLDIGSALRLVDCIESFITSAIMDRFEHAKETQDQIFTELKNYMSIGSYRGAPEHKALIDRLRNMRSKDRKQYIKYCLIEWVRAALGTTLSFTCEDLAHASGEAKDLVTALLAELSQAFGSTPQDYTVPSPVNSLQERPIISGEANYFCPAPHLLPWAIKPAFERALSTSKSWSAYQKHRANYLLDASMGYMSDMLPKAVLLKNLFYPLETGDQAELDGLLLYDRYAVLVEAKAGTLGAAKRGGKLRIKDTLESLVGDAADQVVRAFNFIQKHDNPMFKGNFGTFALDKKTYSECILVTVTLDVLDMFVTEMYQMREIGVVTTPYLPWSLALTDLRAISEVIARPFEFTHYLRWRFSSISDERVSGGKDELNWLAIYLKEGPEKLKSPDGRTRLKFTSYTDSFDAYFLFKEGIRTVSAPRPSQPLPPPMDHLCDALISDGRHGFTQVGEWLLDLSFTERHNLAQKLTEFSFHDGKGRLVAPEIGFKNLTLKLVPSEIPEPVLNTLASELVSSQNKRALVIAVTSHPAWRVSGWAVREVDDAENRQ